MEENKNAKLSYEQLEAYAHQTTEQAKKVFQENQMLKQALNKISIENNFKEIECAIKCLDHADKFSPEFIKAVTSRLEEVLNPNTAESAEADTKEENITKEE